jgi:AraC family transcriptional regulator of adaptative response/methylated-DNA-[protein]-cysteine methyltransferase
MATRSRSATPSADRPNFFRRSKEPIRYAMRRSSLGVVAVAASAKGVVSILIGASESRLLKSLQQHLPDARLEPGGRDAEALAGRVVAFIEAPWRHLDVPLDIRGTAFQQRVWQAVREIPLGRTATYSDIAERIGAPKAIRAVGNACSTNQLAVVVPCHRVLHKDGSLSGGEFWGRGRQQALIDREADAAGRGRPGPARSRRASDG